VGDLHFAADSAGRLRPHLTPLAGELDALLLAGDLTRRGDPAEARVLADELRDLPVPVVAVLGNHDYHLGADASVRRVLEEAGVRVLEGEAVLLETDGCRLGVAGVKGFAGGFAGASATEFGEPVMKEFVATTRRSAEALERALASLSCDRKVALLHYSPVEGTLVGERLGIWPFLGSYLLAEAADRAGADLVLHGHAHAGSREAVTPNGIAVYNVAQAVLGRPFAILELGRSSVALR
jgi:Icc-related predicted phosphoesterase